MTIDSNTRLTQLNGRVKPPAVAGLFYPGDSRRLGDELRRLLDITVHASRRPKALIVPHAGYVYSGPVAATAYACLAASRPNLRRVVLLGPAHRVGFRGIAIPTATAFETPLGQIPVDQDGLRRLTDLEYVQVRDDAFAEEHSLEVQLPFLQATLDNFALLPMVVGDASPDQVSTVLARVWGGEETLIVISTDLSHYHDYETAVRIDTDTVAAIRALAYDRIGPRQACGARPMDGLLKLAANRNMTIELLDQRNSGDTAGGRDRVVGYAAFALYPAAGINPSDQKTLLEIACASIEHGLSTGEPLLPSTPASGLLTRPTGVFVTLTLDGRLRGCIGNTDPVYPLAIAVARNAWQAAFRDPRFPPLSREEFRRTEISISILTPRTEVTFRNEQELLTSLRPGVDGLVISAGQRGATFLPSVWEQLPEPERFLAQLKRKAGMPEGVAVERAWIYQTLSFKRPPA